MSDRHECFCVLNGGLWSCYCAHERSLRAWLSTDVKPASSGVGRSPIDWVFERAEFESFHAAALMRKRATVRFRLEQESADVAGARDGARLQNRLERGARVLERQLSQVSVKEKLEGNSSF